jgi:hypothetical protein
MWDNQFFQILVYSALIFFNLVFIVGFVISLYVLIVIGSIKNKLEELMEQIKATGEKVSDAAESAGEFATSLGSVLTPVAILRGIFGGKKKTKENFFSKLFNQD